MAPGCMEPASPALPDRIDIMAESDTVTIDYMLEPLQLTATVRTSAGAEVGDGEVSWSSSDPAIRIERTGPRSANLTWPSAYTGTLGSVVVSAEIAGLTGQKTFGMCPAIMITALNSGTLVAGRTTALDATVYTGNGGYSLIAPRTLDVPWRWTSSRPEVVEVSGNTATARSVGESILAVSACGQTDSVNVSVVPSGYTVTAIEVGSGTTTPVDLDNSGLVVGKASSVPSNFLWNQGTVTNLGDCVPVDMNNVGQVLCAAHGPTIWRDGTAAMHDTLPNPSVALNDSGHVLLWSQVWTGPGQGSGYWGSAYVSDISNSGHVVWGTSALYSHPQLSRLGVTTDLRLGGRGGYVTAVNDSGDAVGVTEHMTSNGRQFPGIAWMSSSLGEALYLRSTRGFPHVLLQNDVAGGASDINNRRQIVGNGIKGPYLWDGGRLTVLNDMIVDTGWVLESATAINDNGQILAQARQTSSGRILAVLLNPPEGFQIP